ncbi:MAG: sigma factor-like helix-turn-helix DNA-binding protein [Candidatus Ventricola sp.]|nr:sigma factor-like helix-turn-helix DNA-binding protein [Candidatus Ventricola sp.]
MDVKQAQNDGKTMLEHLCIGQNEAACCALDLRVFIIQNVFTAIGSLVFAAMIVPSYPSFLILWRIVRTLLAGLSKLWCCNRERIANEILMTLRSSQKRRGEISLHEPIGTDNEGNEITLIDVLGTDGSEVHGEVERRVSLESIRTLVRSCLHGREKTVIEMRYGLLDGQTHAQQEVAQKLGISRSYVSRIEKKAMQALQKAFESGSPGERADAGANQGEPVRKKRT